MNYRLVPASAFTLPPLPPTAPPLAATPPRMPWERRPSELCQLVTDWREPEPHALLFNGRGAVMEEKRDGIRALWLGDKLVSREGAPLWATEHWWPHFAEMQAAAGKPLFIDGEWQEPGGLDATRRAFQLGAKTQAQGCVWAFDVMPLAEWERGMSSEPLTARRHRLAALLGVWSRDCVTMNPGRFVHSIAEAKATAAHIWRNGGEGIVLKDPTALYVRERSPAWLRIKKRIEGRYPIVDVVASRKDPALAGSVVVDVEGVRVRIPVKLPERQRAEMVTFPDRYVGKWVEVSAMEKTARGSLREPRLERWV